MPELLPARQFGRSCRIIPDGLELREGLDYGTWNQIGTWLLAISNASTWCLGDWLVYGESTFGTRYRGALATTGLSYQTLRNYAWVAPRFPHARRHTNLSFQHHAEVAALAEPAQELWLQRAERLRWSRNELRRERRAAQGRLEAAGRRPVTLQLSVEADRERRWRVAAAARGQPLRKWIAELADGAADAAIDDEARAAVSALTNR